MSPWLTCLGSKVILSRIYQLINPDIHPMVLLPSIASLNTTSNYNPADLFTRPLHPTHHRFKARIPLYTTVTPTTGSTSSGVTASVVSTSDSTSDSVPTVPVPVPSVIDTGASKSEYPFKYPFKYPFGFGLAYIKTPFGIPTSALETSTKVQSDPYTLITGETTVAPDLSSPDSLLAFEFAS